MKPLYTEIEFTQAKSRDKLPLECEKCGQTFLNYKYWIANSIKFDLDRHKFCNRLCAGSTRRTGKTYSCGQCNKEIYRKPYSSRKSKVKHGLHFCSHSCRMTYHNLHKTTRITRSNFESYLELLLPTLYKSFDFLFNDTTAIGSELDIYIPSLKLAFELNGPVHYSPIYGEGQLSKIQQRDITKSELCREKFISLCVIDMSQHNFTRKGSNEKYLKYITDILDKHITYTTS